MFFDEKDLKSKFLQKKNKQKKKIQQNQQQNMKATLIQKNIRTYLELLKLKRSLENKNNNIENNSTQNEKNIQAILLLNLQSIKQIDINVLRRYSQTLKKRFTQKSYENQLIDQNKEILFSQTQFYLAKLYFATINQINSEQKQSLAIEILQWAYLNNPTFIENLVLSEEFLKSIEKIFSQSSILINRLLNLTIKYLISQKILYKLSQKYLLETVLKGFRPNKMEIENINWQNLKAQTIREIIFTLHDQKYSTSFQFNNFENISRLTNYFIKCCKKQTNECVYESGLSYLIEILLDLAENQRKKLVDEISILYKNFLVLMQDEQDLIYFENKIMSHEKMQNYNNIVLRTMQQIFENQNIISIFHSHSPNQSLKPIKKTIVKTIKLLSKTFEDRKILFLRNLLSSDQLLLSLYAQKPDEFYEGLKMKLVSMDDEDFKKYNIFSEIQWKDIIHFAIHKSFKIIKIQVANPNYANKKKLVPFQTRDQQNLILTGLSQTLENLYKKSLRTKKLKQEIFISSQFTQAFYQFNFGTGASAMEKLLKLYPFCFTFESRLQKFKKLVKADKLNHDRTLFLQQDVDEDLIITVRRGYEFLDAYQQCFNKDLRKKYKLVFFNQQGLEQEGIDGGGLIKEFINRVLKSAFSQVYGLFQQNSQHQILPNPYSPSTQEYEFIGKLIGKAVYQGISIEQKFVQPFLNLLIGRKNSFQDIQYIDQDIYKSLVNIKHMKEGIQEMCQTFTIYDQQPNGISKYINLICPTKQCQFDDNVLVTNQNKLEFVMAYSDFKCNKQYEQKTRHFRKGFLKVLKSEWLTLFNNQELNKIISGGQADFEVNELKNNCVYIDYHQKSLTVIYLWQILKEFTPEQKSLFLLYVTSCSRPPTLGFGSLKPRICISRDQNMNHLPTANTCMNVFRLPDYKDKVTLKQKLLYAINSKAGFQFA